ncbi:Cytochrome CYP366D1 [Operophtera brumata]|uniref:Cytochrome CYP366D1 n=1 Tax=Operophtera brumata TaxID=104452 RepID=A0A0L7LNY7_OPEBR|nr:Cytochrome CYP366D1 [Operophtera brumata]
MIPALTSRGQERTAPSNNEMLACLYLIASAVLAAYALLWVRSRRARALLANLPSNPQLPFIGNMLQFCGGGKFIFRQIDQMSVISDEKMQPFVFWIGQYPVLLCHDPDDVRTIANNLIEKPYYYNFGKIWLGDGLVTAPVWKQNVKKLASVFSTSVVEGYQSVFNAQAQSLVDSLKSKEGSQPFDVMHYLARTTLEAICHAALGVARISDSVETEEYYQAFNRCLEMFISRGLNLLMHFDFVYNRTPAHKELARNVRVLHRVSDMVSINIQFRSVLDILLDISESDPLFTEQQIKSEVDTIILGGQETVATTIFFTLLMLGCRPKVQNKLYEE